MKRPSLALTAAAAVLLFMGCIPSVNPFYTDKDVVFNPALPGEWQLQDKSDTPQLWTFEKGNDKAYKLRIQDEKGRKGQFEAHLFKLNDELFIDIIPTDCDYATNQVDLVASCMFPGHLLIRVQQLEPELKLAFFNFDWLEKYLQKHPRALAHHEEASRLVLTDSTRRLQAFVLDHLGEGELFGKTGETGVFVRKTNSPAP